MRPISVEFILYRLGKSLPCVAQFCAWPDAALTRGEGLNFRLECVIAQIALGNR